MQIILNFTKMFLPKALNFLQYFFIQIEQLLIGRLFRSILIKFYQELS